MTQIRRMQSSDIPQLVAMGEHFFSVSGQEDLTSYCPDSMRRTLETWLDKHEVVVIVAVDGDEVVGCISGAIAPAYFNHQYIACQELFWWVLEEKRSTGVGLLLIDSLEEWAKISGCAGITMAALEASHPTEVGRFYSRRGYEVLETHYVRSL